MANILPVLLVIFAFADIWFCAAIKCHSCTGTLAEVKADCPLITCVDGNKKTACGAVYARADNADGTYASMFCWQYRYVKEKKDNCRRESNNIDARCYCFKDGCNNPRSKQNTGPCNCMTKFTGAPVNS